jgi:ABC-type branched-subunit amino acid transport system substrate-binding protein
MYKLALRSVITRHRQAAITVLTVVLAASLAGCASGTSSSTSGSGTTIKVGFMAPLSGGVAFIGQPAFDAVNAWVNYINKQGGIDGAKIQLISIDDKADVAQVTTGIQSLAAQGVVAILGPIISSQIPAANAVAERNHVTLITFGAAPSSLKPTPQWLFQTGPTSGSASQSMSEFAAALVGKGQSVAIAPLDTPSGVQWGQAIQQTWGAANGLKVVSSTPVPVSAADMTVPALKILAGHPTLVMAESTDPGVVQLDQTLRKLGYTGAIVNLDSGGSPAILQQLQDPDFYTQYAFYLSAPETKVGDPGYTYSQVMKAAGLSVPTLQNDYGTGQALALIGGLKICGAGCDPAKFNASLSSATIPTYGSTFGPFQYTPQDHQGLHYSSFYHWTSAGIQLAANGQKFYESANTCCQ